MGEAGRHPKKFLVVVRKSARSSLRHSEQIRASFADFRTIGVPHFSPTGFGEKGLLRGFALEIRVAFQPGDIVGDERVRLLAADVLRARHLAAERLEEI